MNIIKRYYFKYASKENFEKLVIKNKKPIVVVDFRECWTLPNKNKNKNSNLELEKAISERKSLVDLVIVDFDEQYDLAKDLNVIGFPTVIGFVNGEKVKRQSGSMNKAQVQEFLNLLETEQNKSY